MEGSELHRSNQRLDGNLFGEPPAQVVLAVALVSHRSLFAKHGMSANSDFLFQARTPLGFTVCVTLEYWKIVSGIKHPIMAGCEAEVKATLETPDEIRRSKRDADVYLFYRKRKQRRWVCAVTKRENETGFLITAYLTDAIKEGDKIWPS